MRADRLSTLTIGYLFTPVLLFAGTWFRPVLALPALLLLCGGVWLLCREAEALPAPDRPLTQSERLAWLAATLFFTGISGIGAWVGQLSDYDKHNLLFNDLIRQPWPVRYANPQRAATPWLCYYVAYYLPTAALMKVLPLRLADFVSTGWGLLGIGLALRWAIRLLSPSPYRLPAAALLLLLAGIDIPYRFGPALFIEHHGNWNAWWEALLAGRASQYSQYVPPRYFFSGGHWEHSLSAVPLIDQLQQTPQHALPGWLAVGLWRTRQTYGQHPAGLLFIGTALLLWSPFVALGLALLAVLDCPALLRPLAWLHRVYTPSALLLLFLLGGYLLAHTPIAYAGPITDAWQTPADGLLQAGYLLLNYGLPAGLLCWLSRYLPDGRPWARLAGRSALAIALLSSIYVGVFNDFYMRTIIPAQWLFQLALLAGLLGWLDQRHRDRDHFRWPASRWPAVRWPARLLTCWLAIGLFMPVRLVGFTLWALRFPKPIPRSILNATRIRHEADLSHLTADPHDPKADYASQYLGKRDSFASRYLLRQP